MNNHPQFIESLQASPVFARFTDWFYYDQNFYYKNTTYGDTPALFSELPESFQLAALVDWLDSLNIYVAPDPQKGKWISKVNVCLNGRNNFLYGPDQTNRTDALRAGILKAIQHVPQFNTQP